MNCAGQTAIGMPALTYPSVHPTASPVLSSPQAALPCGILGQNSLFVSLQADY